GFASVGAVEVGNIVTLTLTTTPTTPFVVGDPIFVSSGAYTGNFTISAILDPTHIQYKNTTTGLAPSGGGTVARTAGATETGVGFNNVVPITTPGPVSFAIGDTVTIAGVGVSSSTGNRTVTGVSGNTFTYNNPVGGLADSGGGTATDISVGGSAGILGGTGTIK